MSRRGGVTQEQQIANLIAFNAVLSSELGKAMKCRNELLELTVKDYQGLQERNKSLIEKVISYKRHIDTLEEFRTIISEESVDDYLRRMQEYKLLQERYDALHVVALATMTKMQELQKQVDEFKSQNADNKSKNTTKLATIENVTKKVVPSKKLAVKTTEKHRPKVVAKQPSKSVKRAIKVYDIPNYRKVKAVVKTRFAPQTNKPVKRTAKQNNYIKSVLSPVFTKKVEAKEGVKVGAKIQELTNIYGRTTEVADKKVEVKKTVAKPRDCMLYI